MSEELLEKVRPEIRRQTDELIATRRDLHRHPELGYAEFRTAGIVAERLKKFGFVVREGVGGTGVIGVWEGSEPGHPAVAFRADMDALPLQEENTHDFCSKTPGCMHACGHDGHVAILLGFARWLSESGQRFPGPVSLIFQPAEEGGGGAERMIAGAALTDPPVSHIFGLHLWAPAPAGVVAIKAGALMASTDSFTITVRGHGGHGAIPHTATDSVVVAAAITTQLQSIVARQIDPLEPAVVTVGRISAGTSDNIIAERAELVGTARSFNTEVRARIPELIERMARGVAAGHGAEIDFEWRAQYPATINDEVATAFARETAQAVFGHEWVVESPPTMGAEDMSYYLQKIPGCFVFLGAGNPEKGMVYPHHNPRFDFDEDVLSQGVELFASLCERHFKRD